MLLWAANGANDGRGRSIQGVIPTVLLRASMRHLSACAEDPLTIEKIRVDRSMKASRLGAHPTCNCGKSVSFMWKNCRKDVALTFDFYTNSRSGCCSFEEIGCLGTRSVENMTRRHQPNNFDKGFLSTGC